MKIKFENVTSQSLWEYYTQIPNFANLQKNDINPEHSQSDRNAFFGNCIFDLLAYLSGRAVFSTMNNRNNFTWTEVLFGVRRNIPTNNIKNIIFDHIKSKLLHKSEGSIFGLIKERHGRK